MTPCNTVAAGKPPRLDSSCHQVPEGESLCGRNIRHEYVVRPVACNSWFCQRCGYRRGRRVLERMIEEVSEWGHYGLLTLTVDRTKFDSPEAAFQKVRRCRYVGKLMSRLRDVMKAAGEQLGRYIIVLEFQAKSGDGWPHWHLLFESSCRRLPRAVFESAWKTWRDRFQVGGVDFDMRRAKTPEKAVRYVCKYLMKGAIPPPWILDWVATRTIKMVHGSRPCPSRGIPGVQPLVGERKRPPKKDEPAGSSKPRLPSWCRSKRRERTNEDRLVECGLTLRRSVQTLHDDELVEDVVEGVVPGSLRDLADEVGEWALEQVGETTCHKLDFEVWGLIADVESEVALGLEERLRKRKEARRDYQRDRWRRVQRRKNRDNATSSKTEAGTSRGRACARINWGAPAHSAQAASGGPWDPVDSGARLYPEAPAGVVYG